MKILALLKPLKECLEHCKFSCGYFIICIMNKVRESDEYQIQDNDYLWDKDEAKDGDKTQEGITGASAVLSVFSVWKQYDTCISVHYILYIFRCLQYSIIITEKNKDYHEDFLGKPSLNVHVHSLK